MAIQRDPSGAGEEFAGWTRALQDDRATTLTDALRQSRDALERTKVELEIVLKEHAGRPIWDAADQEVAGDMTRRLQMTLQGITVWLDSTGQAAFSSTSPV